MDWSAEECLHVLSEARGLADAELGAYLRREGLRQVTLDQWRAAALDGLAALLVLQERVQAIQGDGDDMNGIDNSLDTYLSSPQRCALR